MFRGRLILSFIMAASSALIAFASGSGCEAKNPKKGSGKSKNRCSGGLPITELLNCASGNSGYDNYVHDFDILRDLAGEIGMGMLLDSLEDTMFFLPNDLAFCELAKQLPNDEGEKYEGECDTDGFDEEAVFEHVNNALGYENKLATLSYHVSSPGYAYKLNKLRDGETIPSVFGGEGQNQIVVSKKAKSKSCGDRVKLIDTGRKESLAQGSSSLGGYPKIHGTHYNIRLRNGCIAHVIKNVLLLDWILLDLGLI